MLELDAVTVRYQTPDRATIATDSISFSLQGSERVVLIGPSGCGKTSLLKAIAGFIAPAGGTIRLAGRTIDGPGHDRIMVFQEFDQLLPWKTAAANIAFPLTKTGRLSSRLAMARAETWLAKLGLAEFAGAYPHTLSGGMKQRVSIARALAMEPGVLLMDEPFGALDALTRSAMQQELLALWRDTRFTLLLVTHSIEEALILGERVIVLSARPGTVRAEIAGGDSSAARQRLRRLLDQTTPP